jgi:hypothetical protein
MDNSSSWILWAECPESYAVAVGREASDLAVLDAAVPLHTSLVRADAAQRLKHIRDPASRYPVQRVAGGVAGVNELAHFLQDNHAFVEGMRDEHAQKLLDIIQDVSVARFFFHLSCINRIALASTVA